MEKELENLIKKAIKNMGLGMENTKVHLEHPEELSHGDYSCNVAMSQAKALGRNPKELAGQIKDEMEKKLPASVSEIEIAGPGFINFHLSEKFFRDSVKEILKEKENFGKVNLLYGKKVLVEHSSPNLFKPFHIGHMMNNAIGESIVRLMKFSGAEVTTMSFPSDISLGVAKAIFIILEKYVKDGQIFKPKDIILLGDAYVEGTKRYEDDESIRGRVKEIADNLYGSKDSPELAVFEACKKFNIAYFEKITAELGSHFDSYIYESEAGIIGKEIVQEYTPAVFTESEGAIVYIPDELKKNLNTAVFINSQGNPTYEAKDLGLLKLKFERENWDVSVFITDSEQVPHFDLVLDAAEKINSQWAQWAKKSVHVPHGRMSFKGQKMSSRLGGVPLATEVIEDVASEAKAKLLHRDSNYANTGFDKIIALAAIKFSILRTKPGQNINFDPDESLSFEGDSGPYLQYTHARINSLIEKGATLGILPKYQAEEVSQLEKILYRFPEIVERSIAEYSPQFIVSYLLEIAHSFNSFYGDNKIIDEENKKTSEHRLALARTTQIILKNGLHLLGIQAPDRM